MTNSHARGPHLAHVSSRHRLTSLTKNETARLANESTTSQEKQRLREVAQQALKSVKSFAGAPDSNTKWVLVAT